MNKIKMVLKRFEKDSIHMVVTLLIAIFASCDNRHSMNNGVTLEEFAIDNIGLDCVIQSVFENKTKAFPCIESDTEKVLSLNLQSKDSVILFVFSFSSQRELIYSIYRNNYRVVGYAKYKKRDVILLSDINHISDFGTLFAEFMHLTGNKKSFEYMLFPDNLYSGKENGTWPYYEMKYDPIYLIYKYKEGNILPPILTTNPSLELDSKNK